MIGRRALGWGLAGVAVAIAGTAVALVLTPMPPSPRGPEPGRTLYQAHCATCHGAGGRGDSWRARLLFLRPGDLANPAVASLPDRYLGDLIRHGGSTLGKPGMPSFGFVLSDTEIEAVIQYVRSLPRVPRDLGRRDAPAAGLAPDRAETEREGEPGETRVSRRAAMYPSRTTAEPLAHWGSTGMLGPVPTDWGRRGSIVPRPVHHDRLGSPPMRTGFILPAPVIAPARSTGGPRHGR